MTRKNPVLEVIEGHLAKVLELVVEAEEQDLLGPVVVVISVVLEKLLPVTLDLHQQVVDHVVGA